MGDSIWVDNKLQIRVEKAGFKVRVKVQDRTDLSIACISNTGLSRLGFLAMTGVHSCRVHEKFVDAG